MQEDLIARFRGFWGKVRSKTQSEIQINDGLLTNLENVLYHIEIYDIGIRTLLTLKR